jgi:hypothetical protein
MSICIGFINYQVFAVLLDWREHRYSIELSSHFFEGQQRPLRFTRKRREMLIQVLSTSV